MKASRALWSAARFWAIYRLLQVGFCAGSLLWNADGKLVFLPKTSWLGEKPYTLLRAFLAAMDQCTAISRLHSASFMVLSTLLANEALCRSQSPFNQALSAAVVLSSMLNFSACSMISSLTNSPPLSDKRNTGAPKILTQYSIRACTIVSFLLLARTQAELYLVTWSIICNTSLPLITLMSTATVSLKSLARGNDTIGLRGGRLKRLHTSHSLDTLSTTPMTNLSSTPASYNNFFNLTGVGCANCLCSFLTCLIHLSLSVEKLGVLNITFCTWLRKAFTDWLQYWNSGTQ